MSEAVAEILTPEERISRMRDCLDYAASRDFSDVEVLGAFIDLHDDHCKTIPSSETYNFYAQLDFPEHGIVFGDAEYSDIVARYDELGGQPRACETEAEAEVEEPAPEDHEAHRPLYQTALRNTNLQLPELVHAKLGALVSAVDSEGMRPSRSDVVAALITFAELDEKALFDLVLRYKKTTRGAYLDTFPELGE